MHPGKTIPDDGQRQRALDLAASRPPSAADGLCRPQIETRSKHMAASSVHNTFDVETLAQKTMQRLSPSAGQVAWIWASAHSLTLIEALAFRIRQHGAFWTLRLTIESLLQRIAQEVPEQYLGLIPAHELRWLADIDAIVEVRDHGSHLPGVPLARRRAMGSEWIALIDEAAKRGCRRVTVVNPTPALAAAYGVPVGVLQHRYWSAANIDDVTLDSCQDTAAAQLANASDVHITSALGTDLRLRIAGRPICLDRDSIPGGEVYVAPHEDSAEGTAVIDRAFIAGKPVERLRLTFARGRVVRVEASDDSGVRAFRQVLSVCNGDKDVIAEFGMGLNAGATQLVGDIMLDEKISGSIHIAIGNNTSFGGRNRSNLHLDLVMLRPTVHLDGSPVVADGVLLLGA